MTFRERLRAFLLGTKEGVQPPIQPQGSAFFVGEAEPPPKNTYDHLMAYRQISWVYKAAKKNAEKVSEIDIRLKRHNLRRSVRQRGVHSSGEVEEVTDHPVLGLLANANDFMTFPDLVLVTQAYLELVGEAFWAVLPEEGQPQEIWPLRPDKVEVLRSDKEFVAGYRYKPRLDVEVTFKPESIVPFREFDPLNPFRGMGAVMAVAFAGDTDLFAAKWNRNFFYNSAVPLMAIILKDTVGERARKRFEKAWRSQYEGVAKAHKTAVVQGVESFVTDFHRTHKEMDFLEQRRFNRDEILAIFGVPKTVLGLTEDVNRANAEATTASWLEHEIRPKMNRLVNTMTEFLLRRYENGAEYFFDFVDPVPANRELELSFYKAQGIPWMTPNEIRRREGLESLGKEGDRLYVPINLVGIDVNPPQSERQFRSGLRKVPLKKPPVRQKERYMQVLSYHRDEFVKTMSKLMAEGRRKLSDEELGERSWRQMIGIQEVFEQRYTEQLRNLFEEQKADALSRLRGEKALKQIEDDVFAMDEWIVTFRNTFRPLVIELIKQQGQDMVELVGPGGAFDVTTERVLNYIENEGLLFVSRVNETTRETLREALREGVKEGEGIDDLAVRIEQVFDEASRIRAEMIARTETISASNFARQESFAQFGVKRQRWFTALDERVREAHARAHGQVRSLGETFEVGGEALRFPGDPNGSPENVIQCRCTLLPVIE